MAGSTFGHDVDAMEPGPGYAVDFYEDNFMGNAAPRRSRAAPGSMPIRLWYSGREAPPYHGGVVMGREKAGT